MWAVCMKWVVLPCGSVLQGDVTGVVALAGERN